MRLKPPPIPVTVIMTLVGLAGLLAVAVTTLILMGNHFTSGTNFVVPASVPLTVRPGVELTAMQELTPAVDAINRPIQDPPEDLTLTITDTQTGDPIPTSQSNWTISMSFFRATIKRRSLATFTAPDHGQITVEVTGAFEHDQVYYIGPTPQVLKQDHAVPLAIAFTGAAILTIAGLSCTIWRLARSGQASLSPAINPFA